MDPGPAYQLDDQRASAFDGMLKALPAWRKASLALKETLLANLVILGEIPSPTFHEAERVRVLQDRFAESGLQDCSTDEHGNCYAILPGTDPEANILVVAHSDTRYSDNVDSTITIDHESATGRAVGDNSLGLAVLPTLATLLETLDIRPRNNLVFMGSSKSLGRGNLEGLRFFLENTEMSIKAGVCVEGVQLGRLSFFSTGMLRGEITCAVPDWSRFGTGGAILPINEAINRMVEIPLPSRPRTKIILGSVESGNSYHTIPTDAVLRFEIRSESAAMVQDIGERIDDIVAEVASSTGADVNVDIFARREPGGIEFGHPLARSVRQIMTSLGVQPRIEPSVSELSALIDHRIPAVTIGMTTGEHMHTLRETILVAPVFTGLAQLVGTIVAIDGGHGDEHPRLAQE
jgi:di/tripeptidase